MKKIIKPKRIKGELTPPPDKSITHRAVILSSIANGTSIIENPLFSDDTKRTMDAFKLMGVKIRKRKNSIIISSTGKLKNPNKSIYCGNSGTTMRLLAGIISSHNISATLTGDKSLSKRPMKRIIVPLRMMGAKIEAKNENFPPLKIKRVKKLKGIKYKLPVPSAQVKSCIILAGLKADGETVIHYDIPSRDHTERMLPLFGGKINVKKGKISLTGNQSLKAIEKFTVPGDFSSASFFIALGLIFPKAKIILKNVGINPTRTGFLKIIKRMNGKFKILNKREKVEPVADIYVEYSKLKGIEIKKKEIPFLIDEIPLIGILGAFAKGTTVVKGAEELRVKESDRIKSIVLNLKKLNVDIEELPDGFIIRGGRKIKGGVVDSFNDHRIALAFSILGTVTGNIIIKNIDSIKISYPTFFEDLKKLYE